MTTNTHFKELREIPAIWRSFGVSLSALFVIAMSQIASAQGVTAADVDTDILFAILKAAASDGGPVDLRADPRPLIADAAYQYEIDPQAIARVSADVIHRRTRVIRAAGLRVADTTVVNQNRKCPGALVMSPVDSLGGIEPKHVDGCPEDPFDVLAVGPPRPGTAVLTGDEVYDRGTEMAARGYWASRVIRTTFGHGGSSAYAADYVLAKRSGRWEVVKIVGLMYSE